MDVIVVFIYKSLKMKSNTLSWNELNTFQEVVVCLKNNKLVLAPSDPSTSIDMSQGGKKVVRRSYFLQNAYMHFLINRKKEVS